MHSIKVFPLRFAAKHSSGLNFNLIILLATPAITGPGTASEHHAHSRPIAVINDWGGALKDRVLRCSPSDMLLNAAPGIS